MTEEFQATRPIYMQIVDKILQKIARGDLLPSEKLPSVREMAIRTGVNPNTIQRTYSELERMKIVETRRGQGTFITDNDDVLDGMKRNMQNEIVDVFISNLKELGMSEHEMVEHLISYLQRKEGKNE